MKQYIDRQNHQLPSVGFISPPAWFDPAPYEFTTAVVEKVTTQQTFPLLPDFDYSLDNIASDWLVEQLCLCAKSLTASGCDLVIQSGSPFAWAKVESEAQARQRQQHIKEAARVPTIMTSVAIVDALRAYQVSNIAIAGTYYSLTWRRAFSHFLTLCGFNVLYAANFSEQGLVQVANEAEHFKYNCNTLPKMVKTSLARIKNTVPQAEAIVIVGTGVRTLQILRELEAIAQCPVISADTVVYWLAARYLNLTLVDRIGRFKDLPLLNRSLLI
jgi:maleate cis-trans isomerase